MSWISQRAERYQRIKALPVTVLSNGDVMPHHSVRGQDREDLYTLLRYEKEYAKALVAHARRKAERQPSETEQKLELLEQREEEYRISKMEPRERMLYLQRKELESQLSTEQARAKITSSKEWKRLERDIDRCLEMAVGYEAECAFAGLKMAMQDKSEPDALSLQTYLEFFAAKVKELDQQIEAKHAAKMESVNAATLKAQAETNDAQTKFDELKGKLREVKGDDSEPPEPLPLATT